MPAYFLVWPEKPRFYGQAYLKTLALTGLTRLFQATLSWQVWPRPWQAWPSWACHAFDRAPDSREVTTSHKQPLNLPIFIGCLQEIQLNIDQYTEIIKVLAITLKNIIYLLPSVRCSKFTYLASFQTLTGLWWINKSVKSLN